MIYNVIEYYNMIWYSNIYYNRLHVCPHRHLCAKARFGRAWMYARVPGIITLHVSMYVHADPLHAMMRIIHAIHIHTRTHI